MTTTPSHVVMGPDGGWGWMVVLATGVGDAIISTFSYVMSPLFIEVRRYFNTSAAATSWFLSLQNMSFALAFIGTSSADHFGARKTVVVFGSIATIGIFISQFAENLLFLYISIGFIGGIGFAGSLSPLHLTNSRYFPHRYALATGTAMIGPGLWMFIFPPLIQVCVDRYGWRGTFLIESAVMANILVCGVILRPLKESKSQETIERSRCDDSLENMDKESKMHQNASHQNEKSYVVNCLSVLCHKFDFLTFVLSRLFLGCAYSGAMFYIQPRANEAMVGTLQETAFLVSVSGICSLIGRIFGSGVIVHLKVLSALNTYIISVTVFGVACLIPQLADTYAGFCVLSGILGMSSGIYFSVSLVCTRDLVGLHNVSFGIALVFFALGTGMVIGPPIAGRLYDTFGNYDYAYYTLGSLALLSGTAMVPWQLRKTFRERT